MISMRLCAALAICTVVAMPALASDEDSVHVITHPEKYLKLRGPQPSREEQEAARKLYEERESMARAKAESDMDRVHDNMERPKAIITGSHTLVPVVIPGTANNYSFIRFPNLNSTATATTIVRMLGNGSGRNYGAVTITAPPRSSLQVSYLDLLKVLGITEIETSDFEGGFTYYLQSSHFLTGVQHIIYNSDTDFFENMSACSYINNISYRPLMAGLANVHTSTLFSRFPSIIEVHNKNPFTTTLRLRVHDSVSGRLLGIIAFNAEANSSYAFNSLEIEQEIGYRPTANDFHMNIIFDGDVTNPPNAMLFHGITNVRVSGSVLNMTTVCSIND